MSDRLPRRLPALALVAVLAVLAVVIGSAVAAGDHRGAGAGAIGHDLGAGARPALTALVDDHGVLAGRRSDDGPSRAAALAAVLVGVVAVAALARGSVVDGSNLRPALALAKRLPRRRGPPAA